MRATAFAFALVGLFVLCYALFLVPKEIRSLDEADWHKVVAFSGKVTSERVNSEQHYFYVGNVSVQCSCRNCYFEGSNVSILGFVDKYNGKLYARALRIAVQ